MSMTSSKPYLLRALYEWILDNNYTPQIVVNAEIEGVAVPQQFVQNGSIVLNISPTAVRKLIMNNNVVEFDARFGGMVRHICVPIKAIKNIYSRENERGMMFGPEFDEDASDDQGEEGKSGSENKEKNEPQSPSRPPRGKPDLKIVK